MVVKKIVVLAFLASLTFVSQIVLSFLPNIELVTCFLMIFAINLNIKNSILIGIVFVSLEWLYWGFGTWIIMYYIIWTLYILVMFLLKKIISTTYRKAILAAFLGLIFGLLFTFEQLVLYGWGTAIIWYCKGIPFDIIHMASNFIVVIVLYDRIESVFRKIMPKELLVKLK